jgi:carbonic anhydrase
LDAKPARGLAVLTCMDARIDPLRIFGLRPGDAAVLRNGGARIDDGMLASLVIARDRLDVTRLAVLGHTDCRGTADARETVAADTARLRADGSLSGVAVAGFVYDVATGRVTSVD